MKRVYFPLLLMILLATACQLGAPPATSAPPTAVPATNTAVPTTAAPTAAPATATNAPATATTAPATATTAPTQAPVALRVAVRADDNSVKIVDTGIAASLATLDAGLLPTMGGAVGGTVYVLDFKDQPQAQKVDQSGTQVIPFVQKPNYGLAVWPGNSNDKPRLAWATSPGGQAPLTSQLYIANTDGSGLTEVYSATVGANDPPFQLVVERWSADGQSLYFSREPYGIGGYIPFNGASSLYRYHLADKSVTELVPFNPTGGKMLCLDDLTPDASLIVGHCVDLKTITVHSLSGGADQTILAPGTVTDYRLVGSARFSPNHQRVAFALARGDPSSELGWVGVSDSLNGQAAFVTLSQEGHYYTVVAWLNDKTLLLQDNTLACNPTCTNSLWTVGVDGTGLTKLTDGTFLTLVGGH